MTNKDNLEKITELLQKKEGTPIQFDFDAILSSLENCTAEQETIVTKLLSIIGGFFGTLTFTGFLFVSGLYESETALALLGVVMIVSAVLISRLGKKTIWDTLSASLYLIGFCSAIFAFDRLGMNFSSISLLFIILGGATVYLSPSYILRFLSVFVIIGSFITFLVTNNLQNFYNPLLAILTIKLVFLFLYEPLLLTNYCFTIPFLNAIRSSLLIALLILFILHGYNYLYWLNFAVSNFWISSASILLLLGYTSYKIAPSIQINSPLHSLLFSIATVVLFIPSFYYPLVAFSILILLLSFRVKYKTGLILAIISFLYSISMMYYSLNYSLLDKSLMLIGTGTLILVIYFIFNKKLLSSEKH